MRPNPGGTPPFDAQYSGGIPILLASSVDLANGSTGIPPLLNLQSPYRQPMMIDEVHFMIRADLTDIETIERQNLGGAVRCRLYLGKIELSHDFIPVWNYGPAIQDSMTAANTFSPANTESGAASSDDVTPPVYAVSHFKWILPRPLYVAPGAVLTPIFQRPTSATLSAATFNAQIAYVGRRLKQDPSPKVIDVPYISTYISQESVVGQRSTGQSSDVQLVNPFLVDLHVQRLIGRVQQRDVTNIAFKDGLGGAAPIQVLMKDSMGNNMTRDFTPWNEIFDVQRRAWTINQILKTKERYYVYIQGLTVSDTVPETAMVSMIGYRKEVVR